MRTCGPSHRALHSLKAVGDGFQRRGPCNYGTWDRGFRNHVLWTCSPNRSCSSQQDALRMDCSLIFLP